MLKDIIISLDGAFITTCLLYTSPEKDPHRAYGLGKGRDTHNGHSDGAQAYLPLSAQVAELCLEGKGNTEADYCLLDTSRGV